MTSDAAPLSYFSTVTSAPQVVARVTRTPFGEGLESATPCASLCTSRALFLQLQLMDPQRAPSGPGSRPIQAPAILLQAF